jgi:carboxypeptidase family protein
MRFMRSRELVLALSLFTAAGLLTNCVSIAAYAQSNISGDVSGSVVDASGAAVPNAQVTVTNVDNNLQKTTTSDSSGNFRVPLLPPGRYKITAGSSGFSTATTNVGVAAGEVTPVTIKLAVGQAATTVEVTAGAGEILHTDDAQMSTSFNLEQIQTLPNPGNDLTFIAQTAPGAVMNTQGGYGNFSVNGLPGTANTYTVNGGYEGDPYLNLNNSGATNLLLGNNDVDNVTVITNSYDASFGGLGGAQVNQISRAGGNRWHGDLHYWWNGRIMNANNYFNKQAGVPRSFDNANQWAAAIGGPLKKDKIFGFIDTEGVRVIIPVNQKSYGPSPAFQAAVLGGAGAADATLAPYGNLADNGNSVEAPVYQTIFNYYNNAKNWGSGSVDPADPRTWIWQGQTTNFGREWLINDRLDFNLGQNDHLFIHSKTDKGVQPTQTSFLDPVFNAESPQPSYEGQINWTHTFSPRLTNQFLFDASYYRAIFTNTNGRALGASNIPFTLIPEGFASGGDWDANVNSSSWVGGANYAFPQGRNVTGYQFNDDASWVTGKHTIKFGYTFRRDDITDYTPSEHNLAFGGGENFILDEGDFAAGFSDEWVERFPRRLSEPVALYTMGGYGEDQWKPVQGLTLTIGLRVEHNSNPVCLTNCVSSLSDSFANVANTADTPYNQLISSGRRQAFFEERNVAFEPRFGFSFLPGGADGKTTIRGGFGMFADYFPAQIMGDLMANMPNVDRFTVLGAAYGNPITLDAADPLSGHAQAVTSNNALQSLFSQGACYSGCGPSLSLLDATGGIFSRPTITTTARTIKLPIYEEWSLSVERALARNTVFSVNYIGNRSYHQPVANTPNAYDPGGTIASLPATRPNAALGSVTEYYSGSWSNYNGVIGTFTSRIAWLRMQFNYAYSHALDTTSNGGFDAFGVNASGQLNPNDLSQNYGNADYDTRHYISANYAITTRHYHGFKSVAGDWDFAGTAFHNSGYPFSVTYNTGDVIYGAVPLAAQLDNSFNHHCGGASHTLTPCDFASHFGPATDFGQQRRNQLYGPNYTDFDLDVAKGFKIPGMEAGRFKIGAQFFNLFNHPNFQIPDAELTSGITGTISNTANTPTSILGAFLGGDASPRLIQFKGTFSF